MNADQERTPSAELATFIAELSFDDIPEDAVRSAKNSFIDTVGATLAGATDGAGAVAADMVRAITTNGSTARLIGSPGWAALTDAAFANGTAAHALDFNDKTNHWIKAGATSVPAIFAVADAEAGVSGKDVITGYIAGFEAMCYLADAINPGHYQRGWHATSTFGTFGAAAVVAKLLDLSEEQIRHTLNGAASMPAGLKRGFGTMAKPMHAGQAGRAGITAAYLAANDFTADPEAIGGEKGFLEVYSGNSDLDYNALRSLGDSWAIQEYGVHVKKYPSNWRTQAAIEATIDLVETHGLTPDKVETIHVTAGRIAAEALPYDTPQTAVEGKFSMPFTVAAALVNSHVGIKTFTQEQIDDPTIQAVRECVSWDVDDSLPYDTYHATVTIDTQDGASYTRKLERPRGMANDPLSPNELKTKFMMCAERSISPEQAQKVYDALNLLEEQADVAEVLNHLN